MKKNNSGPSEEEFPKSFPSFNKQNDGKDFSKEKMSSLLTTFSSWFGFPFSASLLSAQKPAEGQIGQNPNYRVSNFQSNQKLNSRSFSSLKTNNLPSSSNPKFKLNKSDGLGDKKIQQKSRGRGRGERDQQQVVSITYEEIGLFPRSFNRVFDRFFKQLFFDVENLVIQEYRFYRYLFLTTVKCLFILIAVPLFVNFISKNYLIRPITEYYWNLKQPEIFLNSFQQKRAFNELKSFEEKIYFESLIQKNPENSTLSNSFNSLENKTFSEKSNGNLQQNFVSIQKKEGSHLDVVQDSEMNTDISISKQGDDNILNFQENLNFIQKKLQAKTLELAIHYNEESIESITNFFADLISFSTLCFLLFNLEIQINITKSFLLEVFFGLDDSKKSLLILFVTDLLVGYHSPNIWELFFSSFFEHYGLPENETTIFLLVATLPVLLDVLFKYLIFRHLNRASPATVATYHAMIE